VFEAEFPGASGSAAECVVALVRAAETFLELAGRALRGHGRSATGRQVLAVLDGADGPLPAGQIAARVLVTTASMTTVLDTLQRRGLVTRTPDPHDRRRVLVALTNTGRAVINAVLPQMAALQTAVCSGVPERSREQLLTLLAAVHEGLSAVDLGAVADAAPRRHRATGSEPHAVSVGSQRPNRLLEPALNEADE
jgi:DNA-binding MarR family transcriptional regulator